MNQPPKPPDGPVKRCPCGESRPAAMTHHGCCYECLRKRQGCKPTEEHHPFGRHTPEARKIKVPIPGNMHRCLDTRCGRRPEILKRPGDNPLHQIAAVVTTIGEAAKEFADHARREQWPEWAAKLADVFAGAAHSAAQWLLILAGKLEDRLGPTWADNLEMPQWRL
jgi:hypothetical protein